MHIKTTSISQETMAKNTVSIKVEQVIGAYTTFGFQMAYAS